MRRAVFHPVLPSSDHPDFWVFAFMRDDAHVAALEALFSVEARKKRSDPILCAALNQAIFALKKEREILSQHYVMQDGKLLLAWAGSALFKNGGGHV